MVTKEDAVITAAAFLKKHIYPDLPDSVVMLPETAVEFTYGWTVRYDLKEHIETGDFTKAPFSPLMVVPHDGSAAHLAPTFPASAEYMALQASGNWPPTKGQ